MKKASLRLSVVGAVSVVLWIIAAALAYAQSPQSTDHVSNASLLTLPTIPGATPAKNPHQVATTLQTLLLLTVLSLAPALLIMTTAFTRMIIVLSFLRSALGTQNIPPTQILTGLAMFLTFFVMQPTFTQINRDALQPYMKGTMPLQTAVDRGEIPLRRFMVAQTYKDDLALFLRMSHTPIPKIADPNHPADSLPMATVIPAFVISELKTGFIFGFIIYVPFVVIDLVVSALLTSMGMVMLPPTVISLPAKVLVFILADGWHALAGSLAASYR